MVVALSRGLRRLFQFAHWRCVEPVIVFESDDWGLLRRPASPTLQNYGPPGRWADEASETPHDLESLYTVLDHYRDPNNRPAAFVANFVTYTPDFEAIARSQYTEYYDLPLRQSALPAVVHKWQEGFARHLFYPQYHARAHFWPARWLRDLQIDTPGARILFEARMHGGLALILRQGWRYHTEYMDWETGLQRPTREAESWLAGGLSAFEDLFGFRPRSTIAPHYIFTPQTAEIWAKAGIRYIQGTDYRILRGNHAEQVPFSHVFGEQTIHHQILMARTAKFDPRPQHSSNGLESTIVRIKRAFERHIPAVVDTHRINYTGTSCESSADALERLLDAVRPYAPFVLTSDELGEAIAQQGRYQDVWTRQERALTPWRSPLRQVVRSLFRRRNTRLVQHYYEP